MNNKKILLGVVVFMSVAAAYWGISPIFRHVRVDEPLPAKSGTSDAPSDATIETMSSSSSAETSNTMSSQVIGTTGHPASGTVRIVSADGKNYVRYENFKTINGPDIFVYLSKDLSAKEFVNLGAVKATEGNINYEIPNGVNPKDYPYILTWCKSFSVLFNSAKVN